MYYIYAICHPEVQGRAPEELHAARLQVVDTTLDLELTLLHHGPQRLAVLQ